MHVALEIRMEIVHEPERHRWVARLEEGDAELAYMDPGDGVLDLIHTYVPRAARGRGVGEAMVESAFAYAREQGHRVRPSCPFVRAWLVDHPEQREIVES